MQFKTICSCILFVMFSCNNNVNSKANNNINSKNESAAPAKVKKQNLAVTNKYEHIKNIPLPEGFTRLKQDGNSFAAWLENIALKNDNTVYLFNGILKYNQSAQYAVLNISVGNRDLQQCVDAVMRLRAEYLFSQNRMEEIIFIDNESVQYKFSAPYTRPHFTQYLDKVFGMCGSASLAQQLRPKNNFSSIEAGDVIIRGGFPGHAVIVTDVAENTIGERVYMIAQSYMPAQDIHILKNPKDENGFPWYKVNENKFIQTPEYTFRKTELKTW